MTDQHIEWLRSLPTRDLSSIETLAMRYAIIARIEAADKMREAILGDRVSIDELRILATAYDAARPK